MFLDRDAALDYLKKAGIKNPNRSIGKLYYLLNHLRVFPQIKGKRYGNWNGWVTINNKIIKDLFGNLKYFYCIIKRLETDRFIEIDKSYIIGKQSKKYRLLPALNEEEWKLVNMKISECNTSRKVSEHSMRNWKPIDHQLFGLLKEFHIDKIDFFEQTTEHNFIQFPCEMRDAILEGYDSSETPVNRYRFYKRAYDESRAGEWRYHDPDKYGRRHNNLTNLPKPLRKHLYVYKNGIQRRLKSVDVVNSQVLLLLTILPEAIEGYSTFKEVVEEGIFYEILPVLCAKSRPDGKYKSFIPEKRKELKKDYFQYVYGDPNLDYVMVSDIYQAMYDHFPEIHQHIDILKFSKDYRYPAREMQKAESSIIIDYVCTKAANKGLLIAQIYDSILCLEEDVEPVKQLMIEGFKTKNLSVNLRIE